MIIESIAQKNKEVSTVTAITIKVVWRVSARVGHTTLRPSTFASLKNVRAFVPWLVITAKPKAINKATTTPTTRTGKEKASLK